MAKTVINNADTGLTVRNGLNSMFTEIYDGLLPAAPANTAPYVRKNGAWVRTFVSFPYVSGNWYQPDVGITYLGGTPPVAANVIKFVPIVFYNDATVTDLGVNVTTASAGTNFQLAIYAPSPTTGAPDGPPLTSTGNMSGATATQVTTTLSSPVFIPAGIYWAGVNVDAVGPGFITAPGSSGQGAAYFGSPNLIDITRTTAINNYAYSQAATFGTWPTISGTAVRVANSASVIQQSAAVFFKVQ